MGNLRWSTFLRLHAQGIIACDFYARRDGHVPTALRVRGDRAPQPTSDPLQRHPPSKLGMDAATAARDHRVREAIRLLVTRSRQHFCPAPRRIGEKTGNQGTEVAAAKPDGQCDLRTRHRHDSARVSRLVDPTIRIASAIPSEIMDPPLQCRAPAHGAGSWCSRSTARVVRLPKGQFAPSPRGIICSPCQSDPRRIASRILPRAFLCVTEFLRTTAIRQHVCDMGLCPLSLQNRTADVLVLHSFSVTRTDVIPHEGPELISGQNTLSQSADSRVRIVSSCDIDH